MSCCLITSYSRRTALTGLLAAQSISAVSGFIFEYGPLWLVHFRFACLSFLSRLETCPPNFHRYFVFNSGNFQAFPFVISSSSAPMYSTRSKQSVALQRSRPTDWYYPIELYSTCASKSQGQRMVWVKCHPRLRCPHREMETIMAVTTFCDE